MVHFWDRANYHENEATRNERRLRTWNSHRRREPLTGGPATQAHHLDEVIVPGAARAGRDTTSQATRGRRAGDSDHSDSDTAAVAGGPD